MSLYGRQHGVLGPCVAGKSFDGREGTFSLDGTVRTGDGRSRALFQPDPLEDRTGGGEATSRWAVEAAYGLPTFGGRWTGSPHVGLGLATGSRDYSLGWRLAPEAANAPDLSFGVKATRRESDYAEPEHTFGVEMGATW